MRAFVLSGPNQFAPAEIEKPRIASDEILLEMKSAAICGTDMRILTGKKTKGVRYPSVITRSAASSPRWAPTSRASRWAKR